MLRIAIGRKLAYAYFEEQSGRRSAANLLTVTKQDALQANIAKLPDLLRKD